MPPTGATLYLSLLVVWAAVHSSHGQHRLEPVNLTADSLALLQSFFPLDAIKPIAVNYDRPESSLFLMTPNNSVIDDPAAVAGTLSGDILRLSASQPVDTSLNHSLMMIVPNALVSHLDSAERRKFVVSNDSKLLSNPFADTPYRSSQETINALIQGVFGDLTLQSLPPEEVLFGARRDGALTAINPAEIFGNASLIEVSDENDPKSELEKAELEPVEHDHLEPESEGHLRDNFIDLKRIEGPVRELAPEIEPVRVEGPVRKPSAQLITVPKITTKEMSLDDGLQSSVQYSSDPDPNRVKLNYNFELPSKPRTRPINIPAATPSPISHSYARGPIGGSTETLADEMRLSTPVSLTRVTPRPMIPPTVTPHPSQFIARGPIIKQQQSPVTTAPTPAVPVVSSPIIPLKVKPLPQLHRMRLISAQRDEPLIRTEGNSKTVPKTNAKSLYRSPVSIYQHYKAAAAVASGKLKPQPLRPASISNSISGRFKPRTNTALTKHENEDNQLSPEMVANLVNIISLPNYKFYLGKKNA